MQAPPIPPNEEERLAALRRLQILDTLPEQAFDDLAAIASYIMGTPMALVSLVDQDRQWFKARVGMEGSETPRELSFCGHAILEPAPMIVPDALADRRFFDNPFVTGVPNVRFYAGAPLVVEGRYAVGTLCAFDSKPKRATHTQVELLAALGRQVVAQLELRLRLQEQRDVAARLAALQALKQDFYAMVTHDLRTPLTALSGSLALLAANLPPASDNVDTLLDIARRNSERAVQMVGDLLDLEQIDQHAMELERELVDLNELAATSIGLNDTYLSGRNVRLCLERCARPVMVHADQRRLLQVLDNLLSNAIKHAPAGSAVTMAVTDTADGQARITVRDQGRGIPAGLRASLFERFSQASSPILLGDATSNPRSSGIGLYVARMIVEAHGGSIGFECPDQGGTVFTVRLPAAATP